MDINGSIVLDRSGSLLNQLMTVGGPHCKGTCRRTTRISGWLFDQLTKLVQLDHDWPIKDWDLTRLTIKYCITITYLLLNLLSYKWHHKHVGFDPRIGHTEALRCLWLAPSHIKPTGNFIKLVNVQYMLANKIRIFNLYIYNYIYKL